jgi:hypothetical protein
MSNIEIAVRSANGTYTATHKSMRASCTVGALQAAERLGEKLLGLSLVLTVPVASRVPDDHNTRRFKLVAQDVHAWCWQSGLIEIGRELPEGALMVATGRHRDLERILEVLARHGKGKLKGTLLVPGVPESHGNKKVDALTAWLQWCNERSVMRAPGAAGVVFHAKQRDQATTKRRPAAVAVAVAA